MTNSDGEPGGSVEAATAPEYVVVPAYPMTVAGESNLRFELRESRSGDPAGLAFTTVEKLVAQLGRYQPWMILKLDGYRELLARARVGQVVLDPSVDGTAARWSGNAVEALMEVNGGGGL